MKLFKRWKTMTDEEKMLEIVGPGTTGFVDGCLSTLAPVFTIAYAVGTREAFLVGLAASIGAAVSMGISEATADDGVLTKRGHPLQRGLIISFCTGVAGMIHVFPFLISDLHTALLIAYPLVITELLLIAWVRKKYQNVNFIKSLIQVAIGGAVIIALGITIGTS